MAVPTIAVLSKIPLILSLLKTVNLDQNVRSALAKPESLALRNTYFKHATFAKAIFLENLDKDC